MYSNGAEQTSSSKLVAGSKSILSKLTNPLRSRARNLADFHIQPFEPYRQYSPGDVVKGLVVLTVVKPVRITHLTVALHGFVRVLKSPAAAGEVITSEPAIPVQNSRKSQYTGNGHASIFHDEVTLCGEGRLEAGIYEFEFNMQFPSRGLPTSIDFERGTISYLIRATLTRPTSIAATTSCDCKIAVVETVDIGSLTLPKPRIISLEPISKHPRRHTKPVAKIDQLVVDKEPQDPKGSNTPASAQVSERQPGPQDCGQGPSRCLSTCDVQSEISEDSNVSTSSTGVSYRIEQISCSEPHSPTQNSDGSSKKKRTITAKIELLKAGCLPGDSIPITISIQHTKRVRSPHGIIITLYRMGRIDSAPPLSAFTALTGKALERMKHEEYYPKSKTGLGGLSLKSAGSSSVFRKDLSQTLAPLVVDPTTLSTVVTASLRVPEDVFPSICNVPGEMISFRYYIEVVVDLGGKLAGQDRHLPRLGMVSLPSMTNPSGQGLGNPNSNLAMLAAWGGNIVNTDAIRREKSVVACLFEIVVGTTDHARKRGRGNAPISTSVEEEGNGGFHDVQAQDLATSAALGEIGLPVESSGPQPASTAAPQAEHGRHEAHPLHTTTQNDEAPRYEHVMPPLPHDGGTEGQSEKDRIRRAEQTLLPSQPPIESASGPSGTFEPVVPPECFDNQAEPVPGPARSFSQCQPPAPAAMAPSYGTLTQAARDEVAQARDPETMVTEDKQELERRRLMAEASSPLDFPDEEAGEGSSSVPHIPSAPVFTADLYGDSTSDAFPTPEEYHGGLPQYEH